MLLTVIEVKRHVGSSQEYAWQESAQSFNLHEEYLQEDIRLDSPAEVRLTVKNGGDRLLFEGEVKARLKMICGRCLTEFTCDVTYPFEEQFLFSRHLGQQAQTKSDAEEEKELAVLEGDTVEATEMVLDALLSMLPMKPLCREDCRGLCPHCGIDLNHETCSCSEGDSDPRLAALAQWLDKK